MMGLFRGNFLVGNSFLFALSGAGVGLGQLAAYGESFLVADSSVGADILLVFDVQLDFSAQVSFGDYLGDFVAQAIFLLGGKILNFDVFIDFRILENLSGQGASDAVNGGESYGNTFFLG